MPATPTLPGYFDSNNGPDGNWAPLGHVRGAAAVPVSTTVSARQAFLITCSGSGSVTCTLTDGTLITITPAVGDNIYPFGLTMWSTGSATVSAVYNLY